MYVQTIHHIFAYMKEEILQTAVEKINDLPEVHCEIRGEEILLRSGQAEVKLHAEVKTKIVPAQILRLRELRNQIPPFIAIAHYITPEAKALLKKEDIPYADTAGNIFIRAKGIYIFVETGKAHRGKIESQERAFSKAGLKVVYQFLVAPGYINQPYRFIGEKAKVTIATVGKVIHGLLHERYILQADDRHYRIHDMEKLLQRWVTGYNTTLKPKLRKRKYRWVSNRVDWRSIELPANTFWGGAAAAEKLTGYLIADKLVIYTGKNFNEVAQELKMVPDKDGTVELIEAFWECQESGETVHPVLVYADLIESADPRYVETAAGIYKNYVEGKL